MKTLAEIHQEVESEVDSMRLLVHLHAQAYTTMRLFMEQLGRPSDWGSAGRAYLDLGWKDGQLHGLIIQVHLAKEESFLAAEPILTQLLEQGWTQKEQNENASWGYREVTFTKPHPEPPLFWPSHKDWKPATLTATVRMWPHADSQICKKVEDGTEPKYKFVCQPRG